MEHSEATRERSLSRNEARIVLDLEWRNQRTVTLSAVRNALRSSDTYARYLAHRLVRKGWLERLRPGLFRLIPADRGREGVPDTNPLATGAVLARPYFFSFGTACTHYGLTDQVFAEIYVACQRRRRPKTIRGIRYVLVNVHPERFFGFSDANVLGETVQMATRERALLDALDRPRYAGGLPEVSRMIAWSGDELRWDALLEVLGRWKQSALAQRLGYLLDLNQVALPGEQRAALQSLVRPASKVLLGPRHQWGSAGRLARPWNIVENVPRPVLLEKSERPRRRVRFTRAGPRGDR